MMDPHASSSAASAEASTTATADLTLHRLAFENNFKELDARLSKSTDNINNQDKHGNTPLHLAAQLGHIDCVRVLLGKGATLDVRNNDRWDPVDDAIAYGDPEQVKLMVQHAEKEVLGKVKSEAKKALSSMQALPDFYVEIDWDFHTWVPLVSRVLPSDTLKIWKKGLKLRVDSTLLDMTERTVSRGLNTLILETELKQERIMAFDVDHQHQECNVFPLFDVRRHQARALAKQEEKMQKDVAWAMSQPVHDLDFVISAVHFEQALSGFYGFRQNRVENVGPYECSVYHMENFKIVSKKRCEHVTPEDKEWHKEFRRRLKAKDPWTKTAVPPVRTLPPPQKHFATFDDYLASQRGHAGRPREVTAKTKSFRPTLWMSKDFPLAIDSVVQVLDLLSSTSSHVRSLKQFLETKLPPGFPVKLDIPVFPTVTARVTFKHFSHEPVPDSTFQPNPSYKILEHKSWPKERQSRHERHHDKQTAGDDDSTA